MKRLLLPWLTALLLLLGQTALLAHQGDIDAYHTHGDDCVVCHLANALGAAVPASQALVTLSPPAGEQTFLTCRSLTSATLPVARSRAPPAPAV